MKKLTKKQKENSWKALCEVIDFHEGHNLGNFRIPKHTEKVLKDELFEFLEKYLDLNVEFTGNYEEISSVTHDFYYSRNGHGVGFWDREDFYGKHYKELDKLAQSYKELELYTARGGWLYVCGKEGG